MAGGETTDAFLAQSSLALAPKAMKSLASFEPEIIVFDGFAPYSSHLCFDLTLLYLKGSCAYICFAGIIHPELFLTPRQPRLPFAFFASSPRL